MPIFDPGEFWRLANDLSKNGDEASLRSSISRAYYACHLVARDQMFGVDHVRMTSTVKKRLGSGREIFSEHKVVQLAILNNSTFTRNSARMRLSNQLGQLQDIREAADYLRDT